MDKKNLVIRFWKDVVEQNEANLRLYFSEDASIKWHNTDEQFTVAEYLVANCAYPGKWQGIMERMEEVDDTVITVVRVFDLAADISVHATSFIRFREGKIVEMDEYWGDDGKPPQWRLDKRIGRPVSKPRQNQLENKRDK